MTHDCAAMVERLVSEVAFLRRYDGKCPDLYAIRRMCSGWHQDLYHR